MYVIQGDFNYSVARQWFLVAIVANSHDNQAPH